MCYDERMLPQKAIRLLSSLFLLFITLTQMGAISVKGGAPLEDLAGSQALLREWSFSNKEPELEPSTSSQFELLVTTMGRGDPLYVWFGHSGLVVTDKIQDRSVMYDYGIFSFDDNFYQTFALGRLNYEVWATSALARYDLAKSEDREISIITLNL